MSRPITFKEAWRGLRNEGCGWFVAGFAALLWTAFGVRVEEQGEDQCPKT